jgi:hypothetical protein
MKRRRKLKSGRAPNANTQNSTPSPTVAEKLRGGQENPTGIANEIKHLDQLAPRTAAAVAGWSKKPYK